MSPELIAAVGAAVGTAVTAPVLAAWTASQGKKLAELEKKVTTLQTELEKSQGLFRLAVRYIRSLIGHVRELEDAQRDGRTAPTMPPVPELLMDEV
ncbi:hypothetical protein [Nocardia sp. NPDC058480]|uniref:hypothetical protein n=1 Tax=Nocardia sp. NPDC058480 TaxID=3346522 RepID=UPI00365802EE